LSFSKKSVLFIPGNVAGEHPVPYDIYRYLSEVEPVNGIGYGQRE